MSVNPGRSSFSSIERTSSGMPSRIVGSGSDDRVDAGGIRRRSAPPGRPRCRGRGAGDGGDDDDDRERRAFVRAGPVGVAGLTAIGAMPEPAVTLTVPTSEAAGHEGACCSSLPCSGASRAIAWAIARLGAIGHAGQAAGQAPGQGDFDAVQVLGAVGAGELQHEGRVGAGQGAVPAVKAKSFGAAASEPSSHPLPPVSNESVAGRGPSGDPGGQRRRWSSRAAARAASSASRSGAVEEAQLDVFEWQLRVFGEVVVSCPSTGWVRPCRRAWRRCRCLFVFDHQVDRQQRAERVVEGLGEVDRPGIAWSSSAR